MPQDALKLIALKAAAPQFDASKGAEGLPQRILIMPWGENETTEGKIIVNATTLKQLASYNASKNWDRPALDFEHSSVPGSPTYKGEPVKVAGYGTLQVVEGEGIYMLMTSWTEEGRQYAAGGHYGDLSPVVKTNEKGEVIGCHSAALCRHGATPGLIFLSTHTPTNMDKPPQTADEFLAAMRTALGCSNEATPGEILQALTVRLAAPAAKVDDKKDAEGMKALVARLDAQDATLKELAAKLDAKDRADIEAQCVREGKELPKTAKDLPIDKLRALAAELPITVPMEKRTPDVLLLSSQEPPKDDPISKMTGVSAEDRKKYGAAA